MRLEPIGNPIEEKAGEVAGLVAGWAADAFGGRNLVPNSDFTLPSFPAPWQKTPPVNTDPDGTKYTSQNYGWGVELWFKVEPGIYTLTLDARDPLGDSRSRVRASISMRDSAGESLGPISASTGALTTTFQREELQIEVPAGTAQMRVFLLNQDANPGNSYLDFTRIKLERGPRATPWTPAPEDAAQSLPDGETPASPFPPHNPAHGIYTDTRAGSRVFVGDTMVYGDTGTLEIDKDAIKSGRILLSRQGPLVHVHFDQVVFHDAPGNVHLSRLPISYRPMGDTRFPLYTIGSLSSTRSVNIPSSGYFNVYGTDVDTALSGQVTYRTRYSWPLSLHAPTVSS